MLSNRVDRGSALAATTARALGAVHGLSDPEDSDSSDRMASFDNDAFSVDDDAARPSDDKSLGQEATELPARARHTAVATSHTMDMTTTSYEAVSTTAIVDNVVDVSRTCDDRLGWQTPILPGRAGSDAPMPCGKEMSAGPCPLHDDCTPGRVGSMLPVGAAPDPVTTAAVPMGADQGSTWQAIATPRRLPISCSSSAASVAAYTKGDGEDPREQAEQPLLEDVETGPKNSALWPSAAGALPASVPAVYAHSGQLFACTLCAYTAPSLVSLKRHRDSRHRRIAFLDRFSAGFACVTLSRRGWMQLITRKRAPASTTLRLRLRQQ
uniref:C2H2-type domain-containing protein n=1 Tax=Peronospora matthiolae TaxID=2874970 RepID=A0AAV1U213_9STRA